MATAAKQSTTVRISEQTHQRLRELAEQAGEPMQAVMDKAIDQYRRQKFLEECHVAYCALQQDPAAWKDYQEETAAWDAALMDGLDPNEIWTEAASAKDACHD